MYRTSSLRIRPLRHSLLATSLLAALQAHAAPPGAASDDTSKPTDLDKVLVIGQRAERISSGATNLELTIKETPQSISEVTQVQMSRFGADDLNDALRLATGIQVEQWETNRTNYLARGFEIKNTQIDGIGLPNGWGIVEGAMDSFGYDKVEVIRGANGLLTGVGNAAGTLNYVRKRPTNDARGLLEITLGSWSKRRIEADYSAPLTDDGRWAGRVVAAHDQADSYLRGYRTERSFLYGVIDGQVGENGTLTVGYSWQKADSDQNMWGALTFVNSDGTQASWPRSASTTQDWTYWNTTTRTGFLEYTYQLGERWLLKASYNRREQGNDDQLFFAYTTTGLDPVTHTGLLGWAYKGQDKTAADLGDVSLRGQYDLLGREHEAVFGLSYAASREKTFYFPVDFSDPAFGPLPAFPYPGDAIPEPAWGSRTLSDTLDQRLKRAYGATRLNLTDRLKAILGFNWAQYHRDGLSSGAPFYQTEGKTSPYAGLTLALSTHVLAYASYSDIYQPQDQLDINGHYLAPTKGVNYELGLKADWLDKQLLTTLALFKARQNGLATYVGYDFANNRYYYQGVDVQSQGVELEATGRIGAHTDLVFGYTRLHMQGPQGQRTYPWVPRKTANLMLSTRLQTLPALSLGLGGRWQSATSTVENYTGLTVRQPGYTVMNAFVAWDFSPTTTLRLNIGNLGDAKYITSLYQIGYYAPPRHYALNVEWRF